MFSETRDLLASFEKRKQLIYIFLKLHQLWLCWGGDVMMRRRTNRICWFGNSYFSFFTVQPPCSALLFYPELARAPVGVLIWSSLTNPFPFETISHANFANSPFVHAVHPISFMQILFVSCASIVPNVPVALLSDVLRWTVAASGVATYGTLGHVPPSSFRNSVHSAAAASLTVKISKITKEKHVLNYHLSRQKHT